MSKIATIQVTCSKCQFRFPFQMWESVNVTLNPDMKEIVRHGGLFQAICPHCGEPILVDFPTIYHNMDKRIMIHYNPAFENEALRNIMLKASKDMLDYQYTMRFTTSLDDFVEKVDILESGYDDRLMEFCKIYVMGEVMASEECEEMNIRFASTEEDGSQFLLFFPDERIGFTEFQPNLYDAFSHLYGSILVNDKETYITTSWALDYIAKNADM